MDLAILCAETGARFTLTDAGEQAWCASLECRQLTATCGVYAHTGEGVETFFADLARDWRGWVGAREWRSLEGELALSVTRDSVGHVTFRIRMQIDVVLGWTVHASVQVGSGELDALARQVRR